MNDLAVVSHLATGEALYAQGDGHGGATIRGLVAGVATAFRATVRQLPKPTG
ncbi:MAG TPA: hypothetical protein VKG82_01770 [Solirubrobacteraceae bacterium]|nr:hypothetical protein [Solirubrobacteraceae bacterium]